MPLSNNPFIRKHQLERLDAKKKEDAAEKARANQARTEAAATAKAEKKADAPYKPKFPI